MSTGTLVTCLDFELHWGVRDKRSVEDYRANLLGVRDAVPRMLDLFFTFQIHATWATVGMLFCEGKAELLASMPPELPSYVDGSLNPYLDLGQVGESESRDPFHFAPSLIGQIQATPGQEIGTHTFSHYYCLEPGQTELQFRADLEAACSLAAKRGIRLRSIVFPRNQVNPAYLPICAEMGIVAYRGNGQSWFNEAADNASALKPCKRALRLLDAYVPVGGCTAHSLEYRSVPVNVPSSRFLRPFSYKMSSLDFLRLRRITSDMTRAARAGLVYHLWWHPHNLGVNTRENINFLRRIFLHYAALHAEYGMESRTMFEAASPRQPEASQPAVWTNVEHIALREHVLYAAGQQKVKAGCHES